MASGRMILIFLRCEIENVVPKCVHKLKYTILRQRNRAPNEGVGWCLGAFSLKSCTDDWQLVTCRDCLRVTRKANAYAKRKEMTNRTKCENKREAD